MRCTTNATAAPSRRLAGWDRILWTGTSAIVLSSGFALALVLCFGTACNTVNALHDVPTSTSPKLVRVRDCEGPAASLAPELAAKLALRTGTIQPDDL